ncbi:predicted protein [Botrytis cinerea T4]|uniref:Uncharacterized protein n=1 Tax=Botryotinia fuckeliana (strain T4) TaxID=999810 RepID=G2YCT0_BOTF4|nr:predicted protein [Botrytis cinerea T4]
MAKLSNLGLKRKEATMTMNDLDPSISSFDQVVRGAGKREQKLVVCRPWLLTIDLKQGHSNESIRPIWHDGLNFKPSDEGRVFAFWEKGVHPMFFSKQEKEKHILKRRHGMGHGMYTADSIYTKIETRPLCNGQCDSDMENTSSRQVTTRFACDERGS